MQSIAWLNKYIDINNDLRTDAKYDFEINFSNYRIFKFFKRLWRMQKKDKIKGFQIMLAIKIKKKNKQIKIK